jgi:hypothetical protein
VPIDRGVLDQQLQALGEGSRWWEQRELRDLPAVLQADERLLAIARGKVARVARRVRRSWLIVVTEQRLLCLRSSARGNWRQLEVSAVQIARVTLRVGPFHGKLLIVAGGQKYRLLVARADAYKLAAALSRLETRGNESLAAVTPTLMIRRVIDHVLALPAAALHPPAPSAPPPVPIDTTAIEERLHLLEQEVEELRNQVRFMEQLLDQQQQGSHAHEWNRTRS